MGTVVHFCLYCYLSKTHNMSEMVVTLVCVRHGQADHNVEGNKVFQYTQEENPALDTNLTDVGREQARKVAERLAETKFDLAVSSDLRRAKDTAEAISAKNETIKTLEEWRDLRERRLGDFEGNADLCRAQLKVEDGVRDRNLLTWRIPNGESAIDLNERIQRFLQKLIIRAEQLTSREPSILLVSHGIFLKELHRVLSGYSSDGYMFGQDDVYYINTGVSHYQILIKETTGEILKTDCHFYACGAHIV